MIFLSSSFTLTCELFLGTFFGRVPTSLNFWLQLEMLLDLYFLPLVSGYRTLGLKDRCLNSSPVA